jgi:RHS repeat-associated protein
MTNAAAKGRSLLFLAAAFALCAAILAAPAAEATRTLPALAEPAQATQRATLDALEDATPKPPIEPEKRLRLFEDLSWPTHPLELVQISKTASGVFDLGLDCNILKKGGLSQECGSPSFQGLWHDPTTGLAYARNRWYDARTASWLSEDPLGPVDSPNLYAFVAWGPHLYRDPFGLETAAKALGVRGEWFLAQKLRKLGWTVLLGPDVHLWNQPGADIFAVNLKTGEVAFFDDKNWIRKSVSKSGVKALWKNFDISRNIEQALKAIEESDLDEDSKRRFRRKLRFGQFDKVVTAAAPEAQTVGISKSAEKEMIKFMDVSKVEVPDPGPNSGIPDVPKSRTRAIRMRSGGKAPFLIAVVGICFAEDPAYAFGEAIDPVSMVTGGCSEFITDEEAEQIMIENAFLAALYERLECESTSGCSDADEVPLIPAHEVSNTYLESLRSEGWIEVGSSVGAGTQ